MVTLDNMPGATIDLVMTSPPYNTSRASGDLSKHQIRYEDYLDVMTDEEYEEWICKIFKQFETKLKPNGVVCWNCSYSSEKSWALWNVIAAIQKNTDFVVADCIIWKKRAALPNNTSPNKLTRICEFVYVFCRREEYLSFFMNKGISQTRSDNGQTIYNNVMNLIDAPNNDENCPIHKATYSTMLCRKLIDLYCPRGENAVVYDPFMGTGTTAIAAIREKRSYIGSEISPKYCEWANKRIRVEISQLSLF